MIDDGLVSRFRRLLAPGAAADPSLPAALREVEDPATLAAVGRLLDRVPPELLAPERTRLRPVKVAVTATFTADGVVPLLRALLLRDGIAATLHLSGFDQLTIDLTDPGSELARFGPDVTLALLHDGAFLPAGWDPADLSGLAATLRERLDLLAAALTGFSARTGGLVLLHTVPLSAVERTSVVSYRGRAELGRLWRELNTGLLALSAGPVHTLDLEAVLVDAAGPARDDRLAAMAGMAWTAGTEAAYAREAAAFCRAAAGLARKVLVLDLDNTLWGGVAGDDGPEGVELGPLYPGNAYVDMQRRARMLQRQGVLLAIASKNDPAVVDAVLARHPEMVLSADDFVVRAVNWEPKDGNLRAIAAELNLGLPALLLADDSPFECGMVRSALPEAGVLQLGTEPAGHAARLLAGDEFTVLETTAADLDRSGRYRAEAGRRRFSAGFRSTVDYLRELELHVIVRPADEFMLPRLAQLCLRTNQFTVTGAGGAATPAGDPLVLAVEVHDRFGREGVVGGVWLDRRPDGWQIDNMVMSCRVFSRGVEQAVLQHVSDLAVAAGALRLTAVLRLTGRNGPAAAFLPAAGFAETGRDGDLVRYALPLDPLPALGPDWVTLDLPQVAAR